MDSTITQGRTLCDVSEGGECTGRSVKHYLSAASCSLNAIGRVSPLQNSASHGTAETCPPGLMWMLLKWLAVHYCGGSEFTGPPWIRNSVKHAPVGPPLST